MEQDNNLNINAMQLNDEFKTPEKKIPDIQHIINGQMINQNDISHKTNSGEINYKDLLKKQAKKKLQLSQNEDHHNQSLNYKIGQFQSTSPQLLTHRDLTSTNDKYHYAQNIDHNNKNNNNNQDLLYTPKKTSILTPHKIQFDQEYYKQDQDIHLQQEQYQLEIDPQIKQFLDSASPEKIRSQNNYDNENLFGEEGGEENKFETPLKNKQNYKTAAQLWEERRQMLSSGSSFQKSTSPKKLNMLYNLDSCSPYSPGIFYKTQFGNQNDNGKGMVLLSHSPNRNVGLRGDMGNCLGDEHTSIASSIDAKKENNYQSPTLRELSRTPFKELKPFSEIKDDAQQNQNQNQNNQQQQVILINRQQPQQISLSSHRLMLNPRQL